MIAKTFEEVGKKPIDFQSLNHVIFGYVCYLVIFLISTYFFKLTEIWGWLCFIALFLGIMWEVFENIGVPDAFFRVWGLDSLENSLMDIVFDAIGIILGCITSFFSWEVMIIAGFILILVLVFLMYIGMKLTQPKVDYGSKEK